MITYNLFINNQVPHILGAYLLVNYAEKQGGITHKWQSTIYGNVSRPPYGQKSSKDQFIKVQ